jgi:beta-mannosidase
MIIKINFSMLLLKILIWVFVRSALCSEYELKLQNWSFSTCDKRITNIKATIPGNVMLDLVQAGIISDDPYFGFKERELSWIVESCWSYQSDYFEMSMFNLKLSSPSIYLRLEGMDTLATIFLNGEIIGTTENQFVNHRIKVDKSLLLDDMNTIRIDITSALSEGKRRASEYPYSIPLTSNYNVWAEPTNRNFIRKAGRI